MLQAVPYLSRPRIASSQDPLAYGVEVRSLEAVQAHHNADADVLIDTLTWVVGKQSQFRQARFVLLRMPSFLSIAQLEKARGLFLAWGNKREQLGGPKLGAAQSFGAVDGADLLGITANPHCFYLADQFEGTSGLEAIELVMRRGAVALRPSTDSTLLAEVDVFACARLSALNYFGASIGMRVLMSELDHPSLVTMALAAHADYLAGEGIAPAMPLESFATLPQAIRESEMYASQYLSADSGYLALRGQIDL